jgi:hypothetical protein
MMRKMTITQSLITEFVPTMDYVSGPTSKWRGLYIISTKIGINTWLYLKTKNGLKIVVWMQIMTAPVDSWREIVQK